MLFLNHKYNKDDYVKQREEVWVSINSLLDPKTIGKKCNHELKIDLSAPFSEGLEINKADEWLGRLSAQFMQLSYDLSEIILSNKLACLFQGDNEKKAYFLFNLRYYFTVFVNDIYTFWNMVAQYLNVLYSNQNIDQSKRAWEKEEESIDNGFLQKDLVMKNIDLKPIHDLYNSELNKKNIIKLRHQAVHRRKIQVLGLGREFYTKITENMIEFAAEYKAEDPVKLEKDAIELMVKIKEILPQCVGFLEKEIKERKYSHIKFINS